MNVVLWIIQVLLALLFLFAGATKLVLSLEVLKSMGSPNQIMLPGLLLRLIGVCEVLGAFVVGLLTAFVAYGRWRLAPHPGRSGA